MALSIATLVTLAGDATDLTAYTTAAFTPSVNTLILTMFVNSHATAPETVTPSTTTGLTFTSVGTIVNTSSVLRATLWRSLAASGLGNGTVTFTIDASQTATGGVWYVAEVTGVPTTGTNGADAILQSATATEAIAGTTFDDLALAAFGNAANGTFLWAGTNAGADLNPGEESGWTRLGQGGHASPNRRALAAWLNANDTTPSASHSGSLQWAGVACELVAAMPTGVPTIAYQYRQRRVMV
jgi:hypothetical protein